MTAGTMTSTEASAPTTQFRVFISYSRVQSAAADALVDALKARNFAVDIDRRSLPFGEKWQVELAEMIRRSDTVVWLISDNSIRSQWVNWELDEVAKRTKRLVPIMVAETPRDQLPRQIGEIHILPAEGVFDLGRHLDTLIGVLETDSTWLKDGSRLQDRAHEWRTRGRTTARLLSGTALADAERWKDRRPAKAPPPAPEVLDLLLASRQEATRRQRIFTGVVAAVALGASALAGVALWQRGVAVANETRALGGEAQVLTGAAERMIEAGDAVGGALLSLAALPEPGSARPLVPAAVQSLYTGFVRRQELATMDAPGVVAMRPSPDGRRVVALSRTNELRVFDAASGRLLMRVQGRAGDVSPTAGSVVWSADGTRLAAAVVIEDDAPAKAGLPTRVTLWDLAAGREIETPVRHADLVTSLALAADGRRLASASSDGRLVVWDTVAGLPPEVHDLGDEATALAIAPDQRTLAISQQTGQLRLWDIARKADVKTHAQRAFSAVHLAFSADGRRLVAVGATLVSWAWTTEAAPVEIDGGGDVTSVAIGGDLDVIVAGTRNGTVQAWNGVDLTPIGRPLQHPGDIKGVAIAADRSRVVSASSDRTVRIWDGRTGDLVHQVSAGERAQDGPADVHMLADGRAFVAADGIAVRRFALDPPTLLRGHEGWVERAIFSPDGTHLVTGSMDNTARLWSADGGAPLAVLPQGGQRPTALAFSADGSILVTVSGDGTASPHFSHSRSVSSRRPV